MKLAYRDIEPFIKAPNPAARVILVYGPDAGLVKERAQTMGKTVVEDLNDPFNVAVLSTDILSEDPSRLSDEAQAVSMMGGDRLIRIERGGDKLTTLITSYLEAPSKHTLVIIEAGALGTRSSLRKLCEKAKNATAVPCYVEDERDLSRLIRETIQQASLSIDPDAVTFLSTAISGDRGKARSELEKLILYKGSDKTPITLEDAQLCCAAAGDIGLDDLVYSVAGRQTQKALETYDRLAAEDINFIVILRSLQNHFRKLHLTRTQVDNGASIDTAMKALRPPIFFKQKGAFGQQIQTWPTHTLEKTLMKLAALEAQCKKTDYPVDTLCRQAILAISSSRR